MGNNLQPNKALEKKLNILSVIVSIIVLGLIGVMGNPKYRIQTDIDFSFLPPFHSTMNAMVAVALIAALYFIKNKNVKAHRNSIHAAMVFSAMFLLSYVVYHFTNESVKFGDANFDGTVTEAEKLAVGAKRTIYFFFLATHVILAGAILPFILTVNFSNSFG